MLIFFLSAGLGYLAWSIRWLALGGHYFPHATSTKPADKEHDKYQYLVNYSDETVIKYLYLTVDDGSGRVQPHTSQRVMLLLTKLSKFWIGSTNYTVLKNWLPVKQIASIKTCDLTVVRQLLFWIIVLIY